VGDRLPKFTEEQSRLVKGSFDFMGLNHYGSYYARHGGVTPTDYNNDHLVSVLTTNKEGHTIGPVAESSWLYVHPAGFRGILNWIHNRYDKPKIYVLENGVSVPNEDNKLLDDALHDQFRIDYFESYIQAM